jgi:hypothetical protein
MNFTMRSIWGFGLIFLFAASTLWGCTRPIYAYWRSGLPLQNNIGVAALESSPSPRLLPQAIETTQLIEYLPALPEQSRSGACWSHSAAVPRVNAWRCTVEERVYDPCFAVGAASDIVCESNPPGAEAPFRLNLIAPLPLQESTPTSPPLQREALGNIEYRLPGFDSASFSLVDGQYEGAVGADPAQPITIRLSEMQPMGDLNGDGEYDAAALLFVTVGDKQNPLVLPADQRSYLAVILNQEGRPVNIAAYRLEPNIRINHLTIQQGQVLIDLNRHSAQDPPCCPSVNEIQAFNLVADQIVPYVNGWRLELIDGVVCAFDNQTNFVIGEQRFQYRCNDGSWLLGNLQTGAVWLAQRATFRQQDRVMVIERLETAPIRRVWQ